MRKYLWLSASLMALAISAPAAWGQSVPDMEPACEFPVELTELPGQGWVQSFVNGWVKTFQAILQAPMQPDNDLMCPAGVWVDSPPVLDETPSPATTCLLSRIGDWFKNCLPIARWDPDPPVRMEQLLIMSEQLRQTRNGIAQSMLLDTPSNLSEVKCCQVPPGEGLPTQFGVEQPSGFASGDCACGNGGKPGCCGKCNCKSHGKSSVSFPFLNCPFLSEMSSADLIALRNEIGLMCQAHELQEMALMQPAVLWAAPTDVRHGLSDDGASANDG